MPSQRPSLLACEPMAGFDSFLSTPTTGPTYTDLAREVDRLKADNAALPEFCAREAFRAVQRAEWGHNLPKGMTLEEYVPHAVAEALKSRPHPGTALLDEMERLKKEVARLTKPLASESLTDALNVVATEYPSSAAAIWHHVSAQLAEIYDLKAEISEIHKEKAAVVQRTRHGEIRQQAILDFAHELAEMEPAGRDAAIRRVIDRSEDRS